MSCGGRIHYDSRVAKVILADNRAAGTVLGNWENHFVDITVSAAEGRTVIYDLIT